MTGVAKQTVVGALCCRRLKMLSVLILAVLSTGGARGADFRKADFGMSKEEVKESESNKPDLETETQLIYHDIEIAGLRADAKYHFSANWFRRGDYEFHPFQMVGQYAEAFNRLSDWVTERYGKPSDERYVQAYGKKVHTQEFGTVDAQVAIQMMLGSAQLLMRNWDTEEKVIGLLMNKGTGEEKIQLLLLMESRRKAPIQQLKRMSEFPLKRAALRRL